jgi:hypothetical protein
MQSSSFVKFSITGLLLAIVGWGGLAYLIYMTLPYLGPRWLFFFFLLMALTGTSLPAAWYLNRRFQGTPPADGGTILRQAMWVGIYGCILAWLQLGRVLNVAMVFSLAIGFVVIEFLLRLRERSLFKTRNETQGE